MLPDQVDNLLQDQVFLRDSKPGPKCLRNKAPDFPVNTIRVPATRSDMRARSIQSRIFRHIATRCPGNAIQDHGKVDDVTHHTSNILLAGIPEMTKPIGDASAG